MLTTTRKCNSPSQAEAEREKELNKELERNELEIRISKVSKEITHREESQGLDLVHEKGCISVHITSNKTKTKGEGVEAYVCSRPQQKYINGKECEGKRLKMKRINCAAIAIDRDQYNRQNVSLPCQRKNNKKNLS